MDYNSDDSDTDREARAKALLYRVDPVREQKGAGQGAQVPLPLPSTTPELLLAEDAGRPSLSPPSPQCNGNQWGRW